MRQTSEDGDMGQSLRESVWLARLCRSFGCDGKRQGVIAGDFSLPGNLATNWNVEAKRISPFDTAATETRNRHD